VSKGAIAKKNQAMAEYLRKMGLYHGKRDSKPQHNNYPNLNEVGSAAYRRRNK
jgi:hypothetical protein